MKYEHDSVPVVLAPLLAEIIQRELRRGAANGITLTPCSRSLLKKIVIAQRIEARTLNGFWAWTRGSRIRSIITELITAGFLREYESQLVPTIRGVGAVRPTLGFDPRQETLLVLAALYADELQSAFKIRDNESPTRNESS